MGALGSMLDPKMISTPQVVVVELCKDRVGLMLNPEGPRGAQLWNARRVFISGLPGEEGWPPESQILSGG